MVCHSHTSGPDRAVESQADGRPWYIRRILIVVPGALVVFWAVILSWCWAPALVEYISRENPLFRSWGG